MGKSDQNLVHLQEHSQIKVHFVHSKATYISYPVSVDWIFRRSLSEEVTSELETLKDCRGKIRRRASVKGFRGEHTWDVERREGARLAGILSEGHYSRGRPGLGATGL